MEQKGTNTVTKKKLFKPELARHVMKLAVINIAKKIKDQNHAAM